MNTPVIAFFNNKGGVGKTSLVYHLAWMFSELDYKVLCCDLDPQSNLTSFFLDEHELENLWYAKTTPSIYSSIRPLLEGTGDIEVTAPYIVSNNISLLPGDIALSSFEDELATNWTRCLDGDQRAFRIETAFWRLMQGNAKKSKADFILVDLGPNLGSINRAALISSDYVVVPLGADLFSIKGMENLGPTLDNWRKSWVKRLQEADDISFKLPKGRMSPVGYVVQQHGERVNRPVKAYQKWVDRIPRVYRENLLPEDKFSSTDEHELAKLKHYRSLVPLAQEAKKPIFFLKPADGAIGAHIQAAASAYSDFRNLAKTILSRIIL